MTSTEFAPLETSPLSSPSGPKDKTAAAADATKDEANTFKVTAKEEGAAIKDVVKDEATFLTSNAKTEAKAVAEEVKAQARTLGSEAKEELSTHAHAQKAKAASSLNSLAEELKVMASKSEGPAATFVGAAGTKVQSLASATNEKDFSEALAAIKNYAHKNPTTFLLAAGLLGFGAARVVAAAKKNDEGPALTPVAVHGGEFRTPAQPIASAYLDTPLDDIEGTSINPPRSPVTSPTAPTGFAQPVYPERSGYSG